MSRSRTRMIQVAERPQGDVPVGRFGQRRPLERDGPDPVRLEHPEHLQEPGGQSRGCAAHWPGTTPSTGPSPPAARGPAPPPSTGHRGTAAPRDPLPSGAGGPSPAPAATLPGRDPPTPGRSGGRKGSPPVQDCSPRRPARSSAAPSPIFPAWARYRRA